MAALFFLRGGDLQAARGIGVKGPLEVEFEGLGEPVVVLEVVATQGLFVCIA